MKVMRLAAVTIMTALLGACASMSPQECTTADWRAIGYEDGARGRTVDAASRHRQACAKAGVTMDLERYRAGHADGTLSYCRPANGFALGERGGSYNGVCADVDEDAFLIAFEEGREYYRLKRNVTDVERDLRRAENELDDVEDDLKKRESALVADATNAVTRRELLDETKDLAQRVGELEQQIQSLVYELGVSRERLAQYRAERGL